MSLLQDPHVAIQQCVYSGNLNVIQNLIFLTRLSELSWSRGSLLACQISRGQFSAAGARYKYEVNFWLPLRLLYLASKLLPCLGLSMRVATLLCLITTLLRSYCHVTRQIYWTRHVSQGHQLELRRPISTSCCPQDTGRRTRLPSRLSLPCKYFVLPGNIVRERKDS